jgi:ubiquinone/menaquinone biosynthesis C-methylase UbiE
METKEQVRQQFSRVAARYAASPVHAGGPSLDAMIEAARLTGRERVLDVGCGPGHTALAFAPRSAEVVALDLSAEMLEAGRALAAERGVGNLRFEQGDVENLAFEPGSFDVVTSRVSAHHYPDPDRALREIARVLVPGGLFLLVDSVAPEDDEQDTFFDLIERTRDPSHVRNWRISEWQAKLRAAGYEAALLGTWRWTLDFTAWVERMETPPESVAVLRAAFAGASDALKRGFRIRDNADWEIPVALLEGRLPGP